MTNAAIKNMGNCRLQYCWVGSGYPSQPLFDLVMQRGSGPSETRYVESLGKK